MKKYILTIIFGFLLIQVAVSQTQEEMISKIDKEKEQINKSIKSFEKVVKTDDSTGYRYVYLKGNELQLTVATHNDKTKKNKDNWYLYNGRLIYCEIVSENYAPKKTVTVDKYYFDNGSLIAWNTNGIYIDTKSGMFKNAAEGLPPMEEVLLKDAVK
jgi:hypothetical protein